MAEAFLSSSWYRIAELRPKLRDNAHVQRHRYRGRAWYVVGDHFSSRVHRISPMAYLFVALMDGRRDVDDLWSEVVHQAGDEAPSQDDIVRLLSQLYSADLLLCDAPPDALELLDRYSRQKRSRLLQNALNPMSMRIPVWDPDAFLERTVRFVRPLFGRLGVLLWLAVVCPAIVSVGQHWSELSDNVIDRMLATENLLLLSLTFPVVKILHELGHGYAAKVFGGEVHELGVMLLMGMPTPYVDASSSTAFRGKYRRIIVGAGGMLVELFLASLAFYVWLVVEPGPVRALCFNVMAVAGISTIVFNGNPLMRYDGYYMLSDFLEIPNLGGRSSQFWNDLIDKHVFRVDGRGGLPAPAPGELKWLTIYAPASFAYRMMVQVGIAFVLVQKFFFIGVILALWSATTAVIHPIYRAYKYVFTSPRLRQQRKRAVGLTVGVLTATVIALLLAPVPLYTATEGVIWLPESALVRAGTDGFARRLLVKPGAPVRIGDELIESEESELSAQFEKLRWRVAELESNLSAQRFTDRSSAEVTSVELGEARSELARIRERGVRLIVHSGADGTFMVPRADDLPGRFSREGDVLAYVTPASSNIVRATVPQDDIDLVRRHVIGVQVKLPGHMTETYPAVMVREVPSGANQLPSKALSTAGGGTAAVDPGDREGRKTLARVFQFDIELPPDAPTQAFGSRAYVRFDHQWEPLGLQWYRRIRQLLLTRLNA
jgi:putative peptide zinc metalloprotease protein